MTLHVCKHLNQLCGVIFENFYNFLNSDVNMSSLVSTGNCKLGHDCRRVSSRRNCRQLVANSCSHRRRRHDKTVSSCRRRRCVLGVSLSHCKCVSLITFYRQGSKLVYCITTWHIVLAFTNKAVSHAFQQKNGLDKC